MNKKQKIFYIDATSIGENDLGSGGKSILHSFLRNSSDFVYFVGIGGDKYSVGKWIKIKFNNKKIKFFPVVTRKAIMNLPHGLRNFYFLVNVVRYGNLIFGNERCPYIFTRTTIALWYFTLFFKNAKVCFYAPGIRFSDIFVRIPFLKVFLFIFKKVHAVALNRAIGRFAASSHAELEFFLRQIRNTGFKKDIINIPTFVNLDLFRPRDKESMRIKYKLPINKVIFIYVGRLARVKGVDFLIESFLIFNKFNIDALFLIVGDGEERKKLYEKVKELKLLSKVVFMGNQPSINVAELINTADVALVGSYFEGFSVAMVEEFVSGIPIVTTKVSGAEEIIKDGKNGFIVPERDPHLFAQKMKAALDLRKVYDFNKAYVSKFDERLWVERILRMCLSK